MTSLNNNFQQVLAKFTTRLTKQELNDFKFSSLDDVLATVETIQAEQGRRKEMMNLTRIQRFLEAMGQYGQVIEVFLNTSSILCFVWGPMKFCLQVASTWAESFDTLLDAYTQLAENIPLLGQYQHLFKSDPRMVGVLAIMYEDILEFHQVALRVFKQPTWRHLFKSAWKDFKTSFQHILDDLSRHKLLVESQANLIQIQEAQADRAFSRSQFKMIEDAHREKRYLDVMNWLSAVDSVIDQEAAARVQNEYPTTGWWILQDKKIKAWTDSKLSLIPMLWMNGIPGAGKTILASVIVAELLKLDTVSTVYFYCSYQDVHRNTFLAVARALLAQLLNQNRDLLPYLYDKFMGSGQVALVSAQLFTECLETCLTTMPNIYIIIDGLDECDVSERNAILSFFVSLVEKADTPGRLRALFISQDLNDIRRSLRTATTLKLTGGCNKDDIECYATEWTRKIQTRFSIPDITAEYMKTAVCDGAEGMFLFAKLVLTNLFAQATIEKLYEELQPGTFPKGFEQAYSRIVVRVYENPNTGEREIAKRVLGWIACSKRSLSWHEIQAALAINTNDQTINLENRRLCPDVRDICGSLVDVVPGGRVQLVHGTAKSYLVHNNYVQVHHEERKLAVLCLQYLLFDCFDSTLSDEKVKEHIIQGNYAFQDYSTLHWIDHMEASIPYLPSGVREEDSAFGVVITEFEEAYGPVDMGIEDVPEELKTRCQHIEKANYFASLMLLLSYTRKLRNKEETIVGLGDIGVSINKNRSTLESLLSSSSLDLTQKSQLAQYYGTRWYKCPRHSCPYFYNGFPDLAGRDSHLARHEKPYPCTFPSCPRIYLGFSTEKEMKKHIRINHPDPAALFPKLKKEPTKHGCDDCGKAFTRAHNLKAHKRTHANDRPHKCATCPKAFVRKHDLDRHVTKLHPDKKTDEQSSQQTAVASDMDNMEESIDLI